MVTLSLATDRPGKPGTPSATDWHRVTCYERLADTAAQRITPGQLVFVEGRLGYRSWEDRQGQKRITSEIVGRELIILGRTSHADSNPAGEEPADGEPAADEPSDLPF